MTGSHDKSKENKRESPQLSDSSAAKVVLTAGELKEKGNHAFKMAQVMRGTTAGKQYLNDAQCHYIEAIMQVSKDTATTEVLQLVCTLHANLAAVFLQLTPPKWAEAKAAADIALSVDERHVKALYRRAQAVLEDNREGLSESSLRTALKDLQAVRSIEPNNKEALNEVERVSRRVAILDESRKVPEPKNIVDRIPQVLLNRGDSCLEFGGYVWGQTETTVHIFVIARGSRFVKGLCCEMKSGTLNITLPTHLELKGRLHKPVRPDDSLWQLEEGGLILHVELSKRPDALGGEHWCCVWEGHPKTMALSQEVLDRNEELSFEVDRWEAEQKAKAQDPKIAKTLAQLREACPGVSVEWGNSSLNDYLM